MQLLASSFVQQPTNASIFPTGMMEPVCSPAIRLTPKPILAQMTTVLSRVLVSAKRLAGSSGEGGAEYGNYCIGLGVQDLRNGRENRTCRFVVDYMDFSQVSMPALPTNSQSVNPNS